MHMTTLEKIYKPRGWGRENHRKLNPEIISQLPKYSQFITGQKMDPINLIFIGTENGIKHAFEKAGWHSAHPSSPIHLFLGFLSGALNRPYKTGPFTPHFISVGLQDIAFQKGTRKNSFRQRHHIRIWRTKHHLSGGKQVWVAAASYDCALRVDVLPPFVHHHISADLDTERDYIARELLEQGHSMGEAVQMIPVIRKSHPDRNATGAKYYTDGQAQVVEID